MSYAIIGFGKDKPGVDHKNTVRIPDPCGLMCVGVQIRRIGAHRGLPP